MAPTIKPFGTYYNTLLMTASGSFDGATAATLTGATLTNDVTALASTATVGVMALHERKLQISQIGYVGTGNLTVSIKFPAGTPITFPTATIATGVPYIPPEPLLLPAGAQLILSGAAGSVYILAKEADYT